MDRSNRYSGGKSEVVSLRVEAGFQVPLCIEELDFFFGLRAGRMYNLFNVSLGVIERIKIWHTITIHCAMGARLATIAFDFLSTTFIAGASHSSAFLQWCWASKLGRRIGTW